MRSFLGHLTTLTALLVLAKSQLLVSPGAFTPQVPMSSERIIADLLPRNNQIQIFSSLLRDVDSAWAQLSDPSQYSIILAPSNAALHALPNKPWESDSDEQTYGEQAYEGEAGMQRAQGNLKSFVEMHILSAKEWKEGQKIKTMSGLEVWWESQGGKRVVSRPLLLDLRRIKAL